MTTHFRTLGLHPDASQKDVSKAFHRLAQKLHPDLTNDPDGQARFKEITKAYNALKKPGSLEAYRRSLSKLKAEGETGLDAGDDATGPGEPVQVITPVMSGLHDTSPSPVLVLGIRPDHVAGIRPGRVSIRVPVYRRGNGQLIHQGSKALSFRISQLIPVGEIKTYDHMSLFPLVEGERWKLRLVVLPMVGDIPQDLRKLIDPGTETPEVRTESKSPLSFIRDFFGR